MYVVSDAPLVDQEGPDKRELYVADVWCSSSTLHFSYVWTQLYSGRYFRQWTWTGVNGGRQYSFIGTFRIK